MPGNDNNYHYLNKIACHSEVHLEIITPTQGIRLKSRLIGVDPNMSVIIAMPNNSEWFTAKQYMREGQKVIARLMNADHPEACLLAFQSKIQKLMSIAGRWLVLDYPQQVQQVALRQTQRLPIHVNANLLHPESKQVCSTGFLSDLSADGCAFVGEAIKKEARAEKYILQVSIADELKSIAVVIKNSKKVDMKSNAVRYGGALQGDGKKFVEPLLIDCFLN